MSIELDWQIAEDSPPPNEAAPKPQRRPGRRFLKWLFAVGVIVIAALAIAAIYVNSVYRQQLALVEQQIRPIAQQEAQAVAQHDLGLFLALQDTDDVAWRAMQAKRFGRLERDGLPEFGWKAMGSTPRVGTVTLEPGGARLDVFYQFAVSDPMSNGPVSITLRLPQFYKETPSGWVRSNLSVEYWGSWRTLSGKFFAMQYTRRDADLLEPIVPRMDEMLARVCNLLRCPSQPIFVVFENSPDSLANLESFSYGFDDGDFILKLPSPHLTGVPTDARSRDELYRAIGTRVVQALVYEASGRHLNMKYPSSQSIVRWVLVRAGLARSPALTAPSGWPSLAGLPLNTEADTPMLPLALSFVDQMYGSGQVMRLIPAMSTSKTFGEAVSTALRVNPATLEENWASYLRRQANLPPVTTPPLMGELWVSCANDDMSQATIWRINTDGTGATRIVSGTKGPAWLLAWSRDGKRLAYLDGISTTVIDAERHITQAIPYDGLPGWLPDGRLWIDDFFSDFSPGGSRLVNLDTGEVIKIGGWRHTWSPDGKHVTYYETMPTPPTLWVANADGSQPRAIASGYGGVWSPDSKRLAFLGNVMVQHEQAWVAAEIQIIDIERGQVTTLARQNDILRSLGESPDGWAMNGLLWSPDGSGIVASFWREGQSTGTTVLVLLDAQNGSTRAEWRVGNIVLPLNLLGQRVWLDGGRYLILVTQSESSADQLIGELAILDTHTGKYIPGPRTGLWDRSPDGKWLAVPQGNQGILLMKPDLSVIHRLTNMANCYVVAWRP